MTDQDPRSATETGADGGRRLLESWAAAHASLMSGAFGLAQDMLTFSQERFQADIEAWQSLLASRNTAELLERQQQIAQKTQAHYAGHAHALARRFADLLHDATAPFHRHQGRS